MPRFAHPILFVIAMTAISFSVARTQTLNTPDGPAPDTLGRFNANTGIDARYNNELSQQQPAFGEFGNNGVIFTHPLLGEPLTVQISGVNKRSKWENIDPASFKKPAKDDGKYAVFHLKGMNSIGCIAAKVRQMQPDRLNGSWERLFQPQYMKTWASCVVAYLDGGDAASFHHLNIRLDAYGPKGFGHAARALNNVLSYTTHFDSSNDIFNRFDGNIGYFGEIKESTKNRVKSIDTRSLSSKKDSFEEFDTPVISAWAVPLGSMTFIDQPLNPDVITEIGDYTDQADAVLESKQRRVAKTADKESVYPALAVLDKLYVSGPVSDPSLDTRQRTGSGSKPMNDHDGYLTTG